MATPVSDRVVRGLVAGVVLAAGGFVAMNVACTDVGTTNFGDPSGLSSKNIPGEGGVEPVLCGDAALEASGGGGCAVSFAKDIYPNMTANGAWKCASTGPCHGGVQTPLIKAGTPQEVLASLSKGGEVPGNPLPYINLDAGGDPTKSTFECNVNGQCGNVMPDTRTPPAARSLSKDEVCKIDAWLKCGAPNN
jgi:hypothetical protein